MWSNTLNNKYNELHYTFGVTLVIACIVLPSIFAFAEYSMKDLAVVVLLLYSLLGCVPYIEVAQVKNEDSFFTKRLTVLNWKTEIKKNGEYNVLSSNIGVLNAVFPVVTIISFLLFFANKILGEAYVNSNTVLMILLIQTPFNSAFGLNPLGVAITRQNISKHVTQDDLKEFLGNGNKPN